MRFAELIVLHPGIKVRKLNRKRLKTSAPMEKDHGEAFAQKVLGRSCASSPRGEVFYASDRVLLKWHRCSSTAYKHNWLVSLR